MGVWEYDLVTHAAEWVYGSMTYTSSSKLLCTRTSSGSKTAKKPFVRLSTVSVPNRARGSILLVEVEEVGVVEGVVPVFSSVAMFYMSNSNTCN